MGRGGVGGGGIGAENARGESEERVMSIAYVTGKSRITGKLRKRDFLISQPFPSQIASKFGII